MMYIQLPSIDDNTCIHKLNLLFTSQKQLPYMSYSLNHYLNEIKNRISLNESDWHAVKKYTNPYEYIYTNSAKASISKYKPISRAYYKMIEIINNFGILPKSGPMQMFGLAEGPGGFIEAVVNSRLKSRSTLGARETTVSIDDKYYGMTIEDPTDDNVPGWKKTQHFLRLHPNVALEKGIDGTGNLLDANNFLYIVQNYRSKIDLVTGDGGFDFSDNFGGQEQNMVKLLFAQIAFALTMQKPGGSFVLKIFDCFLKPTTELLYLLSASYETVYICKPNTSRCANSERYVVCTGFKEHIGQNLCISCLERSLALLCNINNNGLHVKSIFDDVHIPMHYYNKIEECNCIIGQMQLENISETLSLIDSKYKTSKINNYLRLNMQKCIQWCVKNNVEYNTNVTLSENNIFKPLREPLDESKDSRQKDSGHKVLPPPPLLPFREPRANIVPLHTFKLSDYE